MELAGLDHVALTVADVKQAAAWYLDVLGLERQHTGKWGGIPTFVGKGETGLALFPKRRQNAGDAGILHVAFRATRSGFLAAQRELKNRKIEFEFEDHEISHSIYFCDPDGNRLEITTYELQ